MLIVRLLVVMNAFLVFVLYMLRLWYGETDDDDDGDDEEDDAKHDDAAVNVDGDCEPGADADIDADAVRDDDEGEGREDVEVD